jgi:hypothetical protein
VGYSAADVRDILQDTWAYMQCDHDDDASSSDFFGLNSYSWCSPEDNMQTSSYDVLVDMFKDSAIPVFVSSGTVYNICDSILTTYSSVNTAATKSNLVLSPK